MASEVCNAASRKALRLAMGCNPNVVCLAATGDLDAVPVYKWCRYFDTREAAESFHPCEVGSGDRHAWLALFTLIEDGGLAAATRSAWEAYVQAGEP